MALSAHYRIYEDQSWYDNAPLVQPPNSATGYPTFLRSRDLLTDEVQAKLILHHGARFKTTLSYQYLKTDYWTETAPFLIPLKITPGGRLLSGQDSSHVYAIGATFTPTARLFLSGTFSYQRSTALTASDGAGAIVPYRATSIAPSPAALMC